MREPLQVGKKFDLGGMLGREARRRAAVRVAKFFRPAQPSRCAAQRCAKITVERVESSMQFQRRALLGDERPKLPPALAEGHQMALAKILVKQRENFQLEIRDAAVV